MDFANIGAKINHAIAMLVASADHIPGVVIVHDMRDWTITYMSKRGLRELCITEEEIIGKNMDDYHFRFFNPEDAKDYVPKIFDLLKRNNDDEIVTYFQQVRRFKSPDWGWHMSSTKIFLRDDDGKPLLTITTSFPIDAMHHMAAKASRLLEENNFLRQNYHEYAKLTKREQEVLRLMALGRTSSESAEALFISQSTVETHRKNIKSKLNTSSYYELSQYARAFDLI